MQLSEFVIRQKPLFETSDKSEPLNQCGDPVPEKRARMESPAIESIEQHDTSVLIDKSEQTTVETRDETTQKDFTEYILF